MNNTLLVYTNRDQSEIIKRNLPAKSCEMIETGCYTDLIAISAFALIVDSALLKPDELDTILNYYLEIDGCFSETVIFFGAVSLAPQLKGKLMVYESFEALIPQLKYILLSAYRKTKKSDSFNTTLSYGILILSEIRKHPGITTQELAQRCEKSTRTIQRYIAALRTAGEWIEYDPILKGWNLYKGKSVLWGDFFD